jgi:hypothetical protein
MKLLKIQARRSFGEAHGSARVYAVSGVLPVATRAQLLAKFAKQSSTRQERDGGRLNAKPSGKPGFFRLSSKL